MKRCLDEIAAAGCQVRLIATLHAKMYIAPGTEVFLGSMNLSGNGLERLEEVCVTISDPIAVHKLLDAGVHERFATRTSGRSSNG